jgi:hypothetical protein
MDDEQKDCRTSEVHSLLSLRVLAKAFPMAIECAQVNGQFAK